MLIHSHTLASMLLPMGGAESDIKLSKARSALHNLPAVWRSGQYIIRTKLKLNCVLPVHLYGSECWRRTEHDKKRAVCSPYQKSEKDSTNLLVTKDFKREPSYQMPTTRDSHNFPEKTLEIDWTSPTKRPGGYHNDSTHDPRR